MSFLVLKMELGGVTFVRPTDIRTIANAGAGCKTVVTLVDGTEIVTTNTIKEIAHTLNVQYGATIYKV